MKTTKIVMGMAAAAVMAFSLTGCMMADDWIGNNVIKYNSKQDANTGAIATAKVNFKNDSNEIIRSMLPFKNKKKGITSKIVMDVDSTGKYGPGNMGLVFNLKQNTDKTYNFCLIGFRCVNGKNNANAYVTYYTNVPEEAFSVSDFGYGKTGYPNITHTDINGANWSNVKGSDCSENNAFFDLPSIKKTSDKKLSVIVEIEAQKTGDNAYVIYLYDGNDETRTFNMISNLKEEDKASTHAEALYKINVPRASIGNPTGLIENEIGFYAMVQKGETLSGEWQVADIKNAPNVSKSAEGYANPLNITIE